MINNSVAYTKHSGYESSSTGQAGDIGGIDILKPDTSTRKIVNIWSRISVVSGASKVI
jgi:hypothetical protein